MINKNLFIRNAWIANKNHSDFSNAREAALRIASSH